MLTLLATSTVAAASPAAAAPPDLALSWPLLAGSIAFLVPIGFVLVAAGGLPAEEARQVTLAGLGALALAALGYWACGFGLQFGGVGLIHRWGSSTAPAAWKGWSGNGRRSALAGAPAGAWPGCTALA
jgi:ammonia channel protein AmtB